MQRRDAIMLVFLIVAVMGIFYPLLYTDYLYTDEATALWFFKKGVNLTWIAQGRYLTYKLFEAFSTIHSIHDVMYARLFSLAGWLICLPVWYYMLKHAVVKNGLPVSLLFLCCVYIITMPPFAVYTGWAACRELFIACTCGLASGHAVYIAVKYGYNKMWVRGGLVAGAALLGLASLFTYQNGFGCFFIPFFIQFVATKKFAKSIYAAILFFFLLYGLYYLLFRYSLQANGIEASARSAFSLQPIHKLFFFFSRPLAAAFHFTWIFNEKNIAGIMVYLIISCSWLLINLHRQRLAPLKEKMGYFTGVLVFLILIYLPSLVIQENYASNRTLFALNLAVFILVAETIFSSIKKYKWHYKVAGGIAVLLWVNAWYNFHRLFLHPITTEYNLVANSFLQQYTKDIKTIYFIQPAEDAFKKKYRLVASWDEFGVPSTAKGWTPEPFIKQLLFEKTGSRQLAEDVVVKTFSDRKTFLQVTGDIPAEILVIDVPKLLGMQ